MKRGQKQTGFTIVELLIVIVVIAILASITIVAFNGVQARARDSSRITTINSIMKALDLYKTQYGTFPPNSAANVTQTAICASHNNGYSFSDATDGTWLKELTTTGLLNSVPTPPNNGCNSYIMYLMPGPTAYNCPARTVGYYVLVIVGTEGSARPATAYNESAGTTWRPCPAATAGWSNGANQWLFVKEES